MKHYNIFLTIISSFVPQIRPETVVQRKLDPNVRVVPYNIVQGNTKLLISMI